jgi:hypothetical protein
MHMGDKETFRQFLLENMKRFPARHYAVVMSGHGAAFGGSMIVHNPEGRIRNDELAEVLNDVNAKTGAAIEVLNMNTCFSANTETLSPLRNTVKNVIASESTVFGATQPFSKVIADLEQSLKAGKQLSGKDLATLFVEEARRQPLGSINVETLSAFDMDKFGTVMDSIRALQTALMDENIAPSVIGKAMRESSRIDYSSFPRQEYLTDIGSFAETIARQTDSKKVRNAAYTLRKSLMECVYAEEHGNNASEFITSRILQMLMHGDKDKQGLTGLTVYYDDKALEPESRLDQIQKTSYAKEVNAEAFLTYVGKNAENEKSKRSLLEKARDGFQRLHTDIRQKLSKATGIHHSFLSIGERIAVGIETLLAFRTLGAAGIPAYPAIFGSLFLIKGVTGAFKGLKDALALSREKKLDTAKKELIVDNNAKGALSLAMGTFGLYLLSVLPSTVAWPAALAAVAIRGGKEIARLIIKRDDYHSFREETQHFEAMTTEEKLAYARSRQ